jgi:choice-of-anchor B domain-containing protein
MKISLSVFILFLTTVGFSQLNMNLLSRIDYQILHNAQLNDIWGYVDEEGNEYALVGTTKGVSIVDVTDPENPVEVFWEPGTDNIWRDLVTWGDYAYISTEANDGLLIIDLSPLPHSTTLPVSHFVDGGINYLSAHTVFADAGYCYLFGTNVGNGGVQILDIHTDPMNPILVGQFDNWYCHDGVVQNDTMYLGHIYDGFFSIVDVTDKSNPVLLGTKTTPSHFTHNVWPTTNGKYAFTTDEVMNAYVASYDISDPSNIVELDKVQSSPGKKIVPHNTHFLNDFIVTSYYSDGVVIHDVTYPYNMIEVGNYDTHPLQNSNYDGCWGAYPYLPSGIVLATDREYGLFVLGANYQKAAYLEGTVTDISTGDPIDNVLISIASWQHEEKTNTSGFYATGRPNEGTATVKYEKVGYFPLIDDVVLQNGVITTHDVQLIPIPPYYLTVTVIEEGTGNIIPNAFIRIENEYLVHDGVTNGIGEEDMTLYYEGVYNVTVGKWGYFSNCYDVALNQLSGDFTVELKKGYYDDFSFDYGWYVTGSAVIGLWVRDIPFGTQETANPDKDAPDDCGKYAYVTGNTNNYDFTVDEVDGGDVKLFSPIMDLTGYSDPHINYSKWFYTRYGFTPAIDSLSIFIMNGSQTVLVDVMKVRTFMDYWEPTSIRVLDFIPVTATMQILVETSDFPPDWNVVEAGFDHFFVTNYNPISVDKVSDIQKMKVYPNPFFDKIIIENAIGGNYTIMDINGRFVQEGQVDAPFSEIDGSKLHSGMYFVTVGETTVRIVKN